MEIVAGPAEVELAIGAKIVCAGKTGWKGADRLRADTLAAEKEAAEAAANAPAADGGPSSPNTAVVAAWASPRA